MKTTLVCLLLALCLVSPAFSDTVKIPADKPVASITFPEGWKATASGDTITASNEEGDILIDVIMTRPDMLGPSNDKAWALLKVKPDWDTEKNNKTTQNGMNVNELKIDAKDSTGAAMKLNLTSFEVTKDKGIMLIIRGKGVEENKDEIDGILKSVAAVK
jgi:hypothetical protein